MFMIRPLDKSKPLSKENYEFISGWERSSTNR